MDAWMHGCMDACIHGCMDAWMHGCMDAWMHGCMHACIHACMARLGPDGNRRASLHAHERVATHLLNRVRSI
eukprot:12093777-Heterocapsa_arctica.AAC.1